MRLSKTREAKHQAQARVNALRNGRGIIMGPESNLAEKEMPPSTLNSSGASPSYSPSKYFEKFSEKNDVKNPPKKDRRNASRMAAGAKLEARLAAEKATVSKPPVVPSKPRKQNVYLMSNYRRKAPSE